MSEAKINSEALIEAYNSGEAMNSIAKRFGTYPTTVKRILERNKVKLRHDKKKTGVLYVKDGEKLIEWAKSQGRLVTKAELAKQLGKKRLSPSYFLKYPELGKYVEVREQTDLREYTQKLYKWLEEQNISYKPNDRTALGVSVDALLLGDYKDIAIQICDRPKYVSINKHREYIEQKSRRAKERGISIIFLIKEEVIGLSSLDGKELLKLLDKYKRK